MSTPPQTITASKRGAVAPSQDLEGFEVFNASRNLDKKLDDLRAQPEVAEMLGQLEAFLSRWLPAFAGDQRSYLTVAIGCTGGQHRSVYVAEQLASHFRENARVLVRHRSFKT